jgi:hypothetical protein
LDLTFFGLTSEIVPQVRANLFSQIHEIVFHSQGGYDWGTIFNMPIWLRKFTFHKLKEYYEKQNEEANSDMGDQAQKIKEGKIDLPNHFKGQVGKRPPKY